MNTVNWGLIHYNDAVERQLELLNRVRSSGNDTIVVCTHPSVVTVGRATEDADVFGWDGEIIQSSRGGRASYHGPSQIVIYPIISLSHDRKEVPVRDLHAYMRALENAIIATLSEFGIQGKSRHHDIFAEDEDSVSYTGVWVGSQKIASIGIAAKNWVTYHGLALNVDHDPKAFQGINPCGFQSSMMTSMEKVLGTKVDRNKVEQAVTKNLVSILN